MSRPRLHPPWIPGLWSLLAILLLLGSIFGYYYALARSTHFEHLAEKAEAEH